MPAGCEGLDRRGDAMYDLKWDSESEKWTLTDKQTEKSCELETQGGDDRDIIVAWLFVNTGNRTHAGVPSRVR